MERGNLVIYDELGVIFSQTGEASGDILPHTYPVGLPYIELPYGTLTNHYVASIDVTKTPHEAVLVPITPAKTPEQLEIDRLMDMVAALGGQV